MTGLERGSQVTLVCQCLKAATSGGQGGLLCLCYGCIVSPYAFVFMYQYGACMCMHASGDPFGPMRQMELCSGGGGRHSGKNAAGCWRELRGENVPHSSLPPRCGVVQPQPRPDQGGLAGKMAEV